MSTPNEAIIRINLTRSPHLTDVEGAELLEEARTRPDGLDGIVAEALRLRRQHLRTPPSESAMRGAAEETAQAA